MTKRDLISHLDAWYFNCREYGCVQHKNSIMASNCEEAYRKIKAIIAGRVSKTEPLSPSPSSPTSRKAARSRLTSHE